MHNRVLQKPLFRLKALRLERGIKKDDMANLLGITKLDYIKKENGVVGFTFSECTEVARTLNGKLRDVFDGYFDGCKTI